MDKRDEARAPRKYLARAIAAAAILGFWLLSALGTVGTTIGVSAVVTASSSNSAQAFWWRPRHQRSRWIGCNPHRPYVYGPGCRAHHYHYHYY